MTAVVKGLLKENKAKEALDLFDDMVNELKSQGASEAQAKTQAATEVAKRVDYTARLQKRRAALTLMATQRIANDIKTHTNPMTGAKDPGEAAIAVFENSAGTERIQSVHRQYETLRGRYFASFTEGVQKYGAKGLNLVKNRAGIENVVRERLGEKTLDASAKEIADGFGAAAEMARVDAVNAGADIPKREDWGFPQSHNQTKIAEAGFDYWRSKHDPLLAWDKMVNPDTGLSIPPELRDQTLRKAYDTIITDGMIKLEPGSMAGRQSLANSMAHHRFFMYKSADAWLAYHNEFGDGDIFEVMVGHLDHMAKNNAMLQVLGPNPLHMKEYIKGIVKKEAAAADAAAKGPAKILHTQHVNNALNTVDELYGISSGNAAAPARALVAHSMAGLRNILTSAQLGGAALSAIPGDLMTSRMVAKLNGLKTSRMIGDYVKMLNPLNDADRRLAMRSSLIAENAISVAMAQQRLVGEVVGPEWTRRVADTVMRATLMSPHTQAMRWAFGMEFMATMADNAGKSFGELEGGLQTAMKRYGITAEQWNLLRSTEAYDYKGAKFLRPDDLIARTDLGPVKAKEAANRFMNMIHTETEFAVPTATWRARSALIGQGRAGTLNGELARSFAMYKNFSVSILLGHGRRGLYLAANGDRGAYLAQFVLLATAAGALSMQMKQIAAGKDPRNMVDPKFWGAAMLQGGGLGIWGDFLFSNINRYDTGMMATLAGPVAQFMNDTRNLAMGNSVEAISGDKTNFSRELIRYLDRYTPGGSIWYLRLAIDRLVSDQAMLMTDPEAHKLFRQRINKTQKDYGQKYWWAPGASLPERAPDLESVAK